MLKNPDALRSEKFGITKMAIEHNLVGDDEAGLVDEVRAQGLLPNGVPAVIEEFPDDDRGEID